jgi:hypothetical protein
MENNLEILKREFGGEAGSFILKLRCELVWDKLAFNRLTGAMEEYIQNHSDSDKLDRWVAEGFWYIPKFCREWSEHDSFPKPQPDNYHKAGLTRLDDLAYWYFKGESPYLDGKGFEPLE